MSKEDLIAVLKRANFVIFGRFNVFVRPAIIEEYPVFAMPYPLGTGRDLLDDSRKSNLRAYRRGSQDWAVAPADHAWSVDFITEHMKTSDEDRDLAPPPGFGFSSVLRESLPPGTETTC
eukprot:1811191-Amphidinium_carterae.1